MSYSSTASGVRLLAAIAACLVQHAAWLVQHVYDSQSPEFYSHTHIWVFCNNIVAFQ